ncbi:Uncharacterised protein [uncultured Clostridium sp.]|uniref:HIRAN domain-containing protein n=1 Tax=uncultured Clostridium sp. TaxID=59620 RepID=UPI000821ED74|nr:HIRAN domain-containing protein [uncultured Clostridium sp.]SCJ96919.1 Uncharacterised protein [uncultured Clostridium sp.]
MSTEIYINLEKHWNKNKHKPYKKQELNVAGKNECDGIYSNEYFTEIMQGEVADGLIELIIDYSEDIDPILNYINRYKIINFYKKFLLKLDILIKEEIFLKEEVHNLAVLFIKNYGDFEIIKLGLLMLRFSHNDEGLEILKIFSNHNDFIFYSIEGIKGYEKCNSIIFDIAKKSTGYGRVISYSKIEPITKEIKSWILGDGIKNIFLQEFLVAISFNKVDYVQYFDEEEKTNKMYKILTRNLLLLYDLRDSFINTISFDLVYIYYSYFKKYKYTFDNIYVMCALFSLFYKVDGESNLIDKLDLSKEEEEILDYAIESFVKNDYTDVLKESIRANNTEISKIVDVSMALDIYLSFDEVLEKLEENPLDISLFNYIMSCGNTEDRNRLVDFALNKIDFDKIINTNSTINDDDFKIEYIDDYCFLLIIIYMDKSYKKFKMLNLLALKARYIKTKIEALNNLKTIQEELDNDSIEEINEAYELERDSYQKRGLRDFLLLIKEDSVKIERENIDKYRVKTHAKDIYLTRIYIDETENKDIIKFRKELCKEDIVYLKVDINNEDDEKISIFNNNGFVVGYIKSKENNILKNLIDWGKIIYGKITNTSEDYKEIELALYLSYEDVITEVSNAFNMVIRNPRGYLN